MKNDRLTFHIFEYDLQNISNDNWSGDLENILEDTNMHEKIDFGLRNRYKRCKGKTFDF